MFPHGDLQRGSAEMLVLAVLRERPMYGYQIIRELRSRSEGFFELEEGLLYPTLHRLEQEGLVQSDWQLAESGRRRRYYTLSSAGLAALASAVEECRAYFGNLIAILAPSGGASHAAT